VLHTLYLNVFFCVCSVPRYAHTPKSSLARQHMKQSAQISNVTTHKDYMFKVLVVGDVNTGKTSVIKRYIHNTFSTNYRATIGADFALKLLQWDPQTTIRIQFWDIAGQERFGFMTRVFYKEAVGAFVLFDASRPSTFAASSKWKRDIESKVTIADDPIPAVLLANKIDLLEDHSLKNDGEMETFCKKNGYCGWYETSALMDLNIEKAVQLLVTKILEKVTQIEAMKKAQEQVIKVEEEGEPAVNWCC